jgi:HSP20 family protein
MGARPEALREIDRMKRDERKFRRPTREELWEPVQRLQGQMNELFDEYVCPHGSDPRHAIHRRFGSFSPRIDLSETPAAYVVTAELPGLDTGDIEVTVEEGSLVLRGEKKVLDPEGEFAFRERMAGRFKRTIPFDDEIDESRVEASAGKGVLTVVVPKTPAAGRGRKVEIKTDEGPH